MPSRGNTLFGSEALKKLEQRERKHEMGRAQSTVCHVLLAYGQRRERVDVGHDIDNDRTIRGECAAQRIG